jgi:hypothetical protein
LRDDDLENDMRRILTAVGSAVVVAAISPTLLAQWPPYVPANTPKTPDGKPNLTAPAPKLANGKPDLSGMWTNVRAAAGQRGQAAPPPTPPAEGPPVATFRDVGAGFKDGLPFTPWAADLVKARRAENQKDNPDALCLPMGLMQFHTHGQPRKIIQTADLMLMIFEPNYGLRQIFTDGRSLPNNDPQPWWYGYSIGKWDGDTLVVETTGFRDDVWLDIWGSPLTSTGKMTERYRRVNYGTLQIDITVEDPKAYTKPWTVRVNQRLMVDQELIEFICLEGQKFDKYLRGDLRPKD